MGSGAFDAVWPLTDYFGSVGSTFCIALLVVPFGIPTSGFDGNHGCITRMSARNLPGWRWATITKVALDRLSRSLHSDVCDSDGCCDAVAHSRISGRGSRRSRAAPNINLTDTTPTRQRPPCCIHAHSAMRLMLHAWDVIRDAPNPSPHWNSSPQLSFHHAPIFRLLLKIAVF